MAPYAQQIIQNWILAIPVLHSLTAIASTENFFQGHALWGFIHQGLLKPSMTPHKAQPQQLGAQPPAVSGGWRGVGSRECQIWGLFSGFSFLSKPILGEGAGLISRPSAFRVQTRQSLGKSFCSRALPWLRRVWPQKQVGGVTGLHFLLAAVPLPLVLPLLPLGSFSQGQVHSLHTVQLQCLYHGASVLLVLQPPEDDVQGAHLGLEGLHQLGTDKNLVPIRSMLSHQRHSGLIMS